MNKLVRGMSCITIANGGDYGVAHAKSHPFVPLLALIMRLLVSNDYNGRLPQPSEVQQPKDSLGSLNQQGLPPLSGLPSERSVDLLTRPKSSTYLYRISPSQVSNLLRKGTFMKSFNILLSSPHRTAPGAESRSSSGD